jgi:plastocyanin
MKKSLVYSLALTASLLFSAAAHADDYVITIKGNQFSPEELTIPAGQKVKIIVKNLDATPAEFESSDLNREKVVSANSEIIVFIGPLDSGSYAYFDDFHRDTTKGTVIVK